MRDVRVARYVGVADCADARRRAPGSSAVGRAGCGRRGAGLAGAGARAACAEVLLQSGRRGWVVRRRCGRRCASRPACGWRLMCALACFGVDDPDELMAVLNALLEVSCGLGSVMWFVWCEVKWCGAVG